jgi:pyruvate/2-oxoglutarate dehydrogenase complex dihydrolipoamide acyltransferase (E2) component
VTEKQTGALERLNRGIQESRQEVQLRTMSLAQDYFDDSAEALKQQISENRAALEGLPDQVPGGREEAFQMMFQELMDNYTSMEECINEAQSNVANLDTERIRRQGEVEATDAARREAREHGIDLTEVEGTGSEGRVTVDDVKDLAEKMESAPAGEAAQQARDATDQAAQQGQQVAGQAAGQAREVAGQVAQGAQDALGQATGQVGRIADQSNGSDEEINATDAAKREAAERGIDLSKVKGTGADGRIVIWDVTDLPPEAEGSGGGQLQNQVGDAASQATQGASDAASQAASQVAGQADGAVGQAGGVANQLAEQVVSTAQQTTDQAGQTARQGAGNAVEQANAAQESDEEPKITKAAKRKAEEMGVDISQIQGSGAGGLITIKDVVGA